MTDRHTTNTTPALTPEREAEIRAAHPGYWYGGPWYSEYVDGQADEPAFYRVVHQESGTTLATLPDWAGPIAAFFADAHDAVPELLAELDRARAERGELARQRDRIADDTVKALIGQPDETLPPGGPICTLAAARAAGLDIPPAPAELSAMAETVVAAAQGAPTAEVDLARAVPLMLEALAAAQRERDEALARVAEPAPHTGAGRTQPPHHTPTGAPAMQLSADRLQALAAAHHWTAAATETTNPGLAALYHRRAQENHTLADEATTATR